MPDAHERKAAGDGFSTEPLACAASDVSRRIHVVWSAPRVKSRIG